MHIIRTIRCYRTTDGTGQSDATGNPMLPDRKQTTGTYKFSKIILYQYNLAPHFLFTLHRVLLRTSFDSIGSDFKKGNIAQTKG